jgi:hypothetical protein
MPIMRRQCDKLLSVGDYAYACFDLLNFLLFPEKKNKDSQVFDVENMQPVTLCLKVISSATWPCPCVMN